MEQNSSTPRSTRWNPWPVAIIAFFVVAVISAVSFVVFCNRNPADLIASDYYDQEIRFQGQIDRVERTQIAAPGATVHYDASNNAITITLPPEHASAQPTGNIDLYRPSALAQDQHLKLAISAAGQQQIDASKLAGGLWKVRVHWSAAGKDYFLDQKIVVTSKTS
jgi:hypothetical protein